MRKKQSIKKEQLKFYLWEDVLWDFSPGVMFALAANVKDARRLIRNTMPPCDSVEEGLARRPKVISRPFGYTLHGGG